MKGQIPSKISRGIKILFLCEPNHILVQKTKKMICIFVKLRLYVKFFFVFFLISSFIKFSLEFFKDKVWLQTSL